MVKKWKLPTLLLLIGLKRQPIATLIVIHFSL